MKDDADVVLPGKECGSLLSLGIGEPYTPQSGLSDFSIINLEGVPEDSALFFAATALEANIAYQENLLEALSRIEMNLIENRYRQQEIVESLLKYELERDDGRLRQGLTAVTIKAPFFKSKKEPRGPPPNEETVRIRQDEYQRPVTINFKRLDWTPSDRRILFNAVKQQCVHLLMKPLMDKRSKLINKLDSLNPYQMDERSKVATDLNSIDIEMQVFKENIPGDEFLFGVRNRTDIDWVYISLHSFSGQRDAADCRLHWQNYLHPSINNQPWSNKEVDHLFATVQKHKESQPTVTKRSKVGKKTDRYVDWRQVAILHGNRRSAFSCFCCFMRTIHNPRSWSHTEMSLLKRLVYSFKFQMKISWTYVSEFFDQRTANECKEKFKKITHYGKQMNRWNAEEDQILIQATNKHGVGKWSQISKEVPNRTETQCRERYQFRLSGLYVSEPWTRAADETLIDLIMKYGPTIECAIIAEETLKKQRKDIYNRFRFLMQNYSENNKLVPKYRKVKLLERSEKLRDHSISEQVIEFHKNILNTSSTESTARKHKRVNSAPVVAHKSSKQLKLIDKLSLLEPKLIDPSFLKTEIRRSLPSFSHSTNSGETRHERVNHSLDELIFQRCLPRKMNAKFNFNCNSIAEHLNMKGITEDKQLAAFISQLLTFLKVDFVGALEILKLKKESNFNEFNDIVDNSKPASRSKQTDQDSAADSDLCFIGKVSRAMSQGEEIVDAEFQSTEMNITAAQRYLTELHLLRFSPDVQQTVFEFASSKGYAKAESSTQVLSFPTCVVLPLPANVINSTTSEELFDWNEDGLGDGNFEFDEDMLIEEDDQNEQLRYEILENEDLDISESISGNNHSNSFSLCQDNFSSFFDAKEANASSSSVLANKEEFNPDLPVKYLIKKFCVKDNSKSFSDLHRQDFLANYGFNIRPGQSSPHIRTLLQTNENLTTVLYKDRIFQLVNIQTNVGPRTLLLPIAQLPSKVNGGVNSFHLLPAPTNTELIQIDCFDALEKSNQTVLELLEKCRSQKALAKANSLLNNAVGRTFMTRNEKVKFQDWIKLLPAQNYPPNMKVPFLPPSKPLIDFWEKLMDKRVNILCRGLVCYKSARCNRPMMHLARKMFANNLEPFKYKQCEIAFQLAVYFKMDSTKMQSTVHRVLYQPIKSVPEFSSLEKTCQNAITIMNDNDSLLKLQEKLFEKSDQVQTILQEIKAMPVYQIFKSRLHALFLWTTALFKMHPDQLHTFIAKLEPNNNAHKITEKREKNLSHLLYSHLRKKRMNSAEEAWSSRLTELNVLNMETLENIQQQLQDEILRNVKMEAEEPREEVAKPQDQNQDLFHVHSNNNPFLQQNGNGNYEQNYQQTSSEIQENRKFNSLENNFSPDVKLETSTVGSGNADSKMDRPIAAKVSLKRKIKCPKPADGLAAKRKSRRVKSSVSKADF